MWQLRCYDMQFFLWDKFPSPVYFLMRWNKKYHKTLWQAAAFCQSLFPVCLLHVLSCYCFFIAVTCNLTKPKMGWNFWHVWRKYSCRKTLASKAGAVGNKNSRLQKADFINQRFHRWTLLEYWSKKKKLKKSGKPLGMQYLEWKCKQYYSVGNKGRVIKNQLGLISNFLLPSNTRRDYTRNGNETRLLKMSTKV